jgi:hypothetical protein
MIRAKINNMQPLIVLGMHRSGTGLTVRLLNDLGVFMGGWLSRDAEAVFFQRINRRIYSKTKSNWANVEGLLRSMDSQEFIDLQAASIRQRLQSQRFILAGDPAIAQFFGRYRWESIKEGGLLSWGWKDPRTTLVFPIWLKVFPQARWLHVLRNGIDVAISTHRRSVKQKGKLRNRIFPIDYESITLDFNYCFHLWETYINFVVAHKNLIPPDRYLEIRYEDLLASPQHNLELISEFIGQQIETSELERACTRINRNRLDNSAFAAGYYDKISALASSPLMQKLGYKYPSL